MPERERGDLTQPHGAIIKRSTMRAANPTFVGLVSVLVAGSVACSGEGTDHGPYPASFPSAPYVHDFGGPVLHAPVIYPVFFANDDSVVVGQLKDFVSKVGASQYWNATTSEYGVGAATSAAPIDLTEDAPPTIDKSEIETWLADKLDGTHPEFPTPDSNTMFVLHYPPGTTITGGDLVGPVRIESCKTFNGYHHNITLSTGQDVAYAVIPRCDSFYELSGIDAVTGVESHELIEAATDPYLMTRPAYAEVDVAHVFWSRKLGGGEVADLCTTFPGVFMQFPDLPYTVQRSWSNKAAAAGHDPCVPQPEGQVYFNAVPKLNDSISTSYHGPYYGQSVNVRGVKIRVGESKTIPIDLFSDGDTGGPWSVQVDSESLNLMLLLDRDAGYNGDQLQLTITVNAASPINTEGLGFVVTSTQGGKANTWFGIVGN